VLTDAIAAEAFKLVRNWKVLFWGFLFIPLLALAVGLFGVVVLESGLPPEARRPELAQGALNAFRDAASPLTILFVLIGAAVLFAGEYRWETWRLMLPRASRVTLVAGKIAVFAVAALVTVVLIGLVGVLTELLGAAAAGAAPHWRPAPGWAGRLAGFAAISWLMLLQAGAVAALAAVATRSMMAVLLVPVGLGVGQALLHAQTSMAWMADPASLEPWRLLALPSLAGDVLRLALGGQGLLPGPAVPGALAVTALVSLLAWLVAGYGGAMALFRWQDLSKE